MKSLLRFALVAFSLAVLGGQTARAEDTYTVVVKKVEVEKTKKDGSAWDINDGKPDLAVRIKNVSEKDSKEFKTKTKDDTFSATFDEPTTIKVRPGQTLEFEVLDVDVAANDTMGKTRKEMTSAVLKSGTLKIEKFDRVIHLEVTLKKI